MSELKLKSQLRRIQRTRAKLAGSPERPRLSVSFSNRHVTAQLVDDTSGKSIAFANSAKIKAKQSLSTQAISVAADIAAQAKSAKIKSVVLDRRHKPYHGRVKAFADAVRQAGLEL